MRGAPPLALFVLLFSLLVSLLLAAGAGAQTGGDDNEDPGALSATAVASMLSAEHVENELLVRFEPAAAQQSALSAVGAVSVRAYQSVPGLQLVRVTGDLGEAMQALSNMPGIRYAEPNYVVYANQAGDDNATPGVDYVPSDPLYGQLWGLRNTGQLGGKPGADIDAQPGWDIDRDAGEIIVADIDTGVDYLHPDLAANMWQNPGEIPGNGIDDDLNGYVDDVYGWDCRNDDNDPFDDHSHGTHTSGTLGMDEGNGVGGVGVAHTVQIMALKFLSAGGSGTTADAITCIDYSTLMGAHLSNNSWGGGAFSAALKEAIEAFGAQGGIFVAAAGNSGTNNDTFPHYPSSYETASGNVVAVAATDRNDNLAAWSGGGGSSYGPTSVDLAAPGKDVLSTIPGGGYTTFSGTSMATPHVAGAVALYLSQYPDALPCEVRQALINSAEPLPSLAGKVVSGGRLNLHALLQTPPPECGGGPPPPGGGCDVDVLAWKTSFADLGPSGEYENAVGAIRAGNPGANITEVESNDPAVVAAALAGQDVFFVPELERATAATVPFAAAIAGDLQAFVEAGGVVVIAEETTISAGFINATGLMDVSILGRSFGAISLTVVDPAHPVMEDIPATFTGTNSTSQYSLNGGETMLVRDSTTSNSVVAVKTRGDGHVVQLGFDYFATNPDTERILVNAVGLGCDGGGPPPPGGDACESVLLYDQSVSHGHGGQALHNLGLDYTRAGAGDFTNLLGSRDWDLVVMDFPSFKPSGAWVDAVASHIDGGGRVVMSHWDLDASPALQTALDVSVSADLFDDTATTHPWLAGDAFWTTPNELPGFTGDGVGQWFDDGDRLAAIDGATELGGFTPAPAAGNASVILGNGGKTLTIGYLVDELSNDDSGNGKADGIDAIENGVTRVCGTGGGGGAQYVYVNNNAVGVSNSVTGYSVAADGSLTPLPGSPFATGGRSNGFAAHVDSIAADAAGACLYATDTYGSFSTVSSFAIAADGTLTLVDTDPAGLNAVAVEVDEANGYVFVGNFTADSIEAFQKAADCSLTSLGTSPVSPARSPLDLEVSDDGSTLFVSCDFSNQVSVFSIGAGGSLTHVPGSPFPAGGVQHGLALSPDESLVYVTDEGPDTISGYTVGAGGWLTPVPGGPVPVPTDPIEALVSPENDQLFVSSNRGKQIVVFDILADGSLASVGGFPTDDPTQGPAGLAIDGARRLFQVNGGFLNPAGVVTGETANLGTAEGEPQGVGTATVSVYDLAADGTPVSVPGSPFATGVDSRPTGIVVVGESAPAPDPCFPVTRLEVDSGDIPYGGVATFDIKTSSAITLGSTDVDVEFDGTILEAVAVESSTLSNFYGSIDNTAGRVSTASASFPSDSLAAGETMFSVSFTTVPGVLPGTMTTVTLSDADGMGCDDLAGPVPPIPAPSLPYDIVPGDISAGPLGDVDCDASVTPIDASVVLSLFVRLLDEGELPPPCDSGDHRLMVSDWDLDTLLSPIDASVDLGVFVGMIDPNCTPLGDVFGLPCDLGLLQVGDAPGEGGPESEVTLTVQGGTARIGGEIVVDVTGDKAIDVGASGLALQYDPAVLSVVNVTSPLASFGYSDDAGAGIVRTASAGMGQSVAAGEPLLSVTFLAGPDVADTVVELVAAGAGEFVGIAGPPSADAMPDQLTITGVSGAIAVRGAPACGLGPELLVVLPGLLWWYRRRLAAS